MMSPISASPLNLALYLGSVKGLLNKSKMRELNHMAQKLGLFLHLQT